MKIKKLMLKEKMIRLIGIFKKKCCKCGERCELIRRKTIVGSKRDMCCTDTSVSISRYIEPCEPCYKREGERHRNEIKMRIEKRHNAT